MNMPIKREDWLAVVRAGKEAADGPVKPRSVPTTGPAMSRYWRWWTDVVEAFARRGRGRGRYAPEVYRQLHRNLLSACREEAAARDEFRAYFEALERLAQPWLDLHALERADGEILTDLWERCRLVDLQLNGHDWRGLFRTAGKVLLVLLLVAAAAGGVFLLGRGGQLPVREWLQLGQLLLSRLSPMQVMILLGGLVALVTTILVVRTMRS